MDARKFTAMTVAPRRCYLSLHRWRQSCQAHAGFTFIEVLIAVVLLANATTLLIGLEASAVQRTVRDRNTQQAMLAARRIMSQIEGIEQTTAPDNQSDIPVPALLAQLGAPATTDQRELQVLERLRATILVEDWTPPFQNIENPAMKRISLEIAWGPESFERFNLLYFIPVPSGPL